MFDYVVVYDAKLYIKYEKSNYRDVKKVLHSKNFRFSLGVSLK